MESKSVGIHRALLVHVNFNTDEPDDVNEFIDLVKSTGLAVAATVFAPRASPDPQFFVGKGKADEISALADRSYADVVIFDQALSPAQERNLEQHIKRRVIDRIGLILDIFAQRARTYEGKLQVELAQLQHLSTRLVRGWTHLERQTGGIGLRGPGETQLETDRRLIGQRIRVIHRRLQKVRKQRSLSRQQRRKNDVPVVSLVGYTNAGKSTLFNTLTGSNAVAANRLFATLEPTLRRIKTASGKAVILTDTVGFIRDLPHELIASFRATLEEIRAADLLVHVIDVEQDQRQQRIDEVNRVIDLIEAAAVPQIEVYNKIDNYPHLSARIKIPGHGPLARTSPLTGTGPLARIWLSSRTGEGIEHLIAAIDKHINRNITPRLLNLPVTAGRLRAKLLDMGAVRHEDINVEGGWVLKIEMEDFKLTRLCEEARLDISELQSGAARY